MNSTFNWPTAPLKLQALIDAGATAFARHQLYFGHGTANAWDEALWLCLHVLQLPWSVDAQVLQQKLAAAQINSITRLFERRIIERIPAAYLTERGYFGGLEFIVSPDVLVPRSPIAEIIANHFQPWLTSPPSRILDLCTGSACIGIACAYAFPDAKIDCTDISEAALIIANRNITRHHVHDRVTAFYSDVFAAVNTRYDLIVSNPPYVDADDMAAMPAEYRAEPVLGLAAGIDGLTVCRQILATAENFLNDNGCLIVEVGNSWHALEHAYPQVPFTWVEFEHGGDGVFVLSANELKRYAPYFRGDDILS